MKEIEILVKVNDNIEKVLKVFKKFEYIETKEVIDEYYYDPKRANLKPDENNQLSECLRLRQKGNKNYITYKDDVFENRIWLYSNEYETTIDSLEMLKEILKHLGLKKLLTINNKKRIYKYKEYEIALEEVKELGHFIEVEYCTNEEVDVKKIKNEIQKFIDSLGLNVSEELNMGKPEMILRNNKINICNE